MLREFVVRPLHAWLVATRHDDAALELVGHDGLGDTAKELKGALVTRDPVRDLLGARRFRVRVVRGAQHGDEEFDSISSPVVASMIIGFLPA